MAKGFLEVSAERAKRAGIPNYMARKIVAKEQPQLAADFVNERNAKLSKK